MKQVWISRAGGPDVLEVRETPDPTPGPGEVLIDVHAAGVNFADLMARAGKYGAAPDIPCVVGYEVSGEVVGIGSSRAAGDSAPLGPVDARNNQTSTFKPGDRVMSLTRFGGYSSKVSVPANQVYSVPKDMDFNQAASIPVNYYTAYLAMIRICNAQPGDNVLIHNAGGGVGIAAVQLAKHIGARIFGTASAWKHSRLRELGVDEVIDYRTGDWTEELLKRSAGQKMDVVLDPIGGRNLKRDLSVMGQMSRLVAYGFSEPVRDGDRKLIPTLRSLFGMPTLKMVSLMTNNRWVGGINMANLWDQIGKFRSIGDAIALFWKEEVINPVIHAEVPFDSAPESHRILLERENLGKVLLIP